MAQKEVTHVLTRFQFVIVLVSLFAIGSVFGYLSGIKNAEKTVYVPIAETSEDGQIELQLAGPKTVRMKLPAISVANETGVSAFLDVTIKPGDGNIFVNLNNVLVSPETQHSARLAARVASELAKKSIKNIDIVYDMKADATILEGPSAGAAFTIATMAALQNKSLRQDIMITGTINHDGSIGTAGKILEKSKAAKEANAKLFLVPVGTSYDVNYTQSEYCSTWGEKEFCTTEVIPKVINIAEEAGIEIIEVRNAETASKFFIV